VGHLQPAGGSGLLCISYRRYAVPARAMMDSCQSGLRSQRSGQRQIRTAEPAR
jgi:hypothetical protein